MLLKRGLSSRQSCATAHTTPFIAAMLTVTKQLVHRLQNRPA